jgi:hypothetical protein
MSLFSFDFFSIEDSQVKKKEEKKIEKGLEITTTTINTSHIQIH